MLQIALRDGILKPGLNVQVQKVEFINDKNGLKQSLNSFRKNLDWIEHLDLFTSTKDIKSENADKNVESTHDDFQHELQFYSQAKAAILIGLPQIAALGIPTKRPNDYFSEMAKTDSHMKKVKEKLLSKQLSLERLEKIRKLREQKKYGKKVQQDILQSRQKEKKEILQAVKHYKNKGKEANLDFLNESKSRDNNRSTKTNSKKLNKNEKQSANKKRQYKNARFGFGGQKKRSKQNTKFSSSETDSFSRKKNQSIPCKDKGKQKQKRPGKSRRNQMQSKRHKKK